VLEQIFVVLLIQLLSAVCKLMLLILLHTRAT